MFSRLLIVRLKAAEKAAKDGRLDEAFRLVTAADLREHRRGAAVLAKLADRFVERARGHFADERFAEALNDLTKAEAAGAKRDAVAELRGHVRTVADEVARQARSQRVRVEEAKERVGQGSLAAGKQLLAGADSDHAEARRLAADIEDRQARAAEGFVQVEKMVKQNQLPAAVERFRKIKALDPHAAKAIELESVICERVVADAKKALEQGRINRAIDEMSALGSIGQALAGRRDMTEILELARSASRALDGSDFEGTRRHLLRLQRLLPKIGWVNKTADQLEKLTTLLTAVYGGPLGEHAKSDRGGSRSTDSPSGGALNETVLVKHHMQGGATLPDRLLVLVDGGGSYLLLRNDRLTIGRAMTQNLPDIPIQSNLAERHAEISRVDDDYFLFSGHDIEVDGRRTRHQLLRSGNRVVLSGNAKFSFRMPHRQSPSGIIEIGSSTRMPGDVRRVVLFRQTAMIGFGKNVHITCNTAEANLVLFERAGKLWVRPQRAGNGDIEAKPLVIGEQMEMGKVSLVVQPFKPTATGPSI